LLTSDRIHYRMPRSLAGAFFQLTGDNSMSAKKSLLHVKKSPARNSKKSRRLQPDMRNQMIAESAYFRALGRGFVGGDTVLDWLAAEDEIDRLLINQI